MIDIISENWRTPELPTGNYYASLGYKCGYFYATQRVTEDPVIFWIVLEGKKTLSHNGRNTVILEQMRFYKKYAERTYLVSAMIILK